MDINKLYYEVCDDYEEAKDDDNDVTREAPSEYDIDEGNSKRESGHMEI